MTTKAFPTLAEWQAAVGDDAALHIHTDQPQLTQIKQQRRARIRGQEEILHAAQAANRALLASEQRTFEELKEEIDGLDDLIDILEGRLALSKTADRANRRLFAPDAPDGAAPPFVRMSDGRRAAVERRQSWADHEVIAQYRAGVQQREQAIVGQHGSLGMELRAMSTSSGSAVVPTVWAADIIDRARNKAAVLRAGAQLVPMDAKTVQIGRLTGDPTAAFRAEGNTVTASDPVFDNVTLDSKTMSALVVGSLEWFQDAPNVDEVVAEAIAQAVALQLDLAALFGGLTTGSEGFSLATPPNPRGILATLLAVAASSVLGSGANGTPQTALSYWNEVVQTLFFPQTFNEAPNGMIWNAKLAQQYASGYDSTGQPLRAPADIEALEKFVSNQIPSFTQGTMTGRATDLFVGDFSQLIIGQRLEFTVQTLVERYAELGQVGIIAHWRGDVQLARPRAFSVFRYLEGAA